MTRPQFSRKELLYDLNNNNIPGQQLFNGSTWDKQYNNTQGTLLASSARTALITSQILTNYNAKGVQVQINVSAGSTTGSLSLNIGGYDVNNNGYWVAQSPAISGGASNNGRYVLEVYPGVTTNSSFVKNGIPAKQNGTLPRSWWIQVVPGDSSAWTYEVNFSLIL